jgi:hypothetical protein
MGEGVPVGSMQRSCLKDEQRYEFNSELSVEDGHRNFVVEKEQEVGL